MVNSGRRGFDHNILFYVLICHKTQGMLKSGDESVFHV